MWQILTATNILVGGVYLAIAVAIVAPLIRGGRLKSLRTTLGSLRRGAKLFEDLQESRRQALELSENIIEGLTVAGWAIDSGKPDMAEEAVKASLISARRIVTELQGPAVENSDVIHRLAPGDLRRRSPAFVE